ncbi:monooxygenase [Laetiporus sulphureus 93-53]|uniref:Monooxygenase n=1 Tax=Laetiporus sulphureus 93-53 TaxID=1314785 RepID=A0A165DQ56_9APHY|nr:monooxygenase [Laetiporus sulphureus 93-53]KZT05380.1 monooxygenase [Laetiporus sulphureus 93-53]
MPQTLSTPVLIVGAGPVGLVLALTLLKNGTSVRIIDKLPSYHAGSRGAGVMPRSLELYNYLGVLPDMQAEGVSLIPNRVYKLPGGVEVLKEFYMQTPQDPTPDVPYINALLIGQNRQEGVLRKHLEKYGCHVELNTELHSFRQQENCVVAEIVKKTGESEQRETVLAQWLVGTDGAKGVVRKQLGLTFDGETRGGQEHFLIGDLEIFGISKDALHSWGNLSERSLALRPTYEGDIFNIFAAGHADYAKLIDDREQLVKFVHSVSNRDDIKVGKVIWLSAYTPNIRMVDKFGEGRVFVAGDAAHVHSPSGGQGLNSGIQDAINLGWKLSLVEKGIASRSLLSTYNEERLPVIKDMLKRTTAILGRSMATKVENDISAWKRDGLLNQLGVNYCWSSIVVDERTPCTAEEKAELIDSAYGGGEGIRAGDRAPDAPGLLVIHEREKVDDEHNITSLFHIFRPGSHTALIFSAESDSIGSVLKATELYPEGLVRSVVVLPQTAPECADVQSADLLLSDGSGHAYEGYAVSPTRGGLTIVIVRPDGVIGGIVLGVDGLKEYFRNVFSALAM